SVHVLPPSSVAMTPLALVLAPFEVQPTHPCDGSGNATATAMPTPEGQGSGWAVHVRPPSAVDSSSATIGPITGPGAGPARIAQALGVSANHSDATEVVASCSHVVPSSVVDQTPGLHGPDAPLQLTAPHAWAPAI